MATPLSWAQRAKGDQQLDSTTTDSLVDSTPPPLSTCTSKANSSDNWRAVTPNKQSNKQDNNNNKQQQKEKDHQGQQGGWQKMQAKKDNKSNRSRSGSHSKPHPRPHRHSTVAALSPSPSASSSLKPTTPTPSSPTSWADHDDDLDATLPSPSFPAVSLPLAPIPTTLALDSSSSLLPPNPPDQPSSTADDDTPTSVEPPKIVRNPAPIPKVNVWSVRKEQLASAAPPPPSPTPATPTTTTPAQPRELTKKEAKKARAAAAAASSSSAELKSNNDSNIKTGAPLLGAPVASSSTSSTAPAPTPAPKRKPEGWSGVKPLLTSSTSVPVLGGDVESWPSPNEEGREKKERKKKGTAAAAAAGVGKEQVVSAKEVEGAEAGGKKKGDKTKWIPIKADITVANSRTFNASGAPQTGGETKRKGSTRRMSSNLESDASKAGKTATTTGEKKPTAPRAPQPTPSSSTKASTTRNDHPLPQKPTTHPSTAPSTSSSNKAANKARAAQLAQSKSNTELAATTAKGDAAGGGGGSNGVIIRPFANANAPKDSSTTTRNPIPNPNPTAAPSPSLPSSSSSRPSNAPRSTPSTRGSHSSSTRGGGRPSSARAGLPSSSSHSNPSFARGGHSGLSQLSQAQGAPVPLPMFVDGQQQAFDPNFGGAGGAGGAGQQQTEAMQMQMPDPRVLDPTRYWLLGQLEWWFSVDNLCRDLFLRSKMDAAGWIDISIIASFNRIKNLTTDQSIVRDTMCFTPLLEVVDNYVRLRQHWPEWILPNAGGSRVSEQREREERERGYTPFVHAQMGAQLRRETENDEAIAGEVQREEEEKKEGAGVKSEVRAVEEEEEEELVADVPAAVATGTIADKEEEPTTAVVAGEQEQASSEEGEDDGEGTAATTISTGSQAGEGEREAGEETAVETEGGGKKSVNIEGPSETTDVPAAPLAPSTTTDETIEQGAGAAKATGAEDLPRNMEELAARDAAARKPAEEEKATEAERP